MRGKYVQTLTCPRLAPNCPHAEVALSTHADAYFASVKGRKPEARVYRDHTGRIYGVERFPQSKSQNPIPLVANNSRDAIYQGKSIRRALEDTQAGATLPPTIA
jgi:hypothetical protein